MCFVFWNLLLPTENRDFNKEIAYRTRKSKNKIVLECLEEESDLLSKISSRQSSNKIKKIDDL